MFASPAHTDLSPLAFPGLSEIASDGALPWFQGRGRDRPAAECGDPGQGQRSGGVHASRSKSWQRRDEIGPGKSTRPFINLLTSLSEVMCKSLKYC